MQSETDKHSKYFYRLLDAYHKKFRDIISMGGTSSSKTYSELQLLLYIAKKRDEKKKPVSISIVSESLPHLKLGAIKDFKNILKARDEYNDDNIHHTEHRYYFGESYIEFFAADIGKATGPRRDILLLNEVNNIPRQVVQDLTQRTSETVFYDFNPTAEFWIVDDVFSLPDDQMILLKSNHLDNEFLPESLRRIILQRAERDPNYKRVHIDIEFGANEGVIFPDFTLIDDMPGDATSYGMDFGFSNDPTTIVDVRFNNGEIFVDLLLYRTEMTNQDIIRFLKTLNIARKEVIADSAEPKSIREIELAGFHIIPSIKGEDSIRTGIDLIKQYKLNITKRSVELIKELRNYQWAKDRNGVTLNKPVDMFNHAIDALRYNVAYRKMGAVKAPKVWIPGNR